MADIFNKQYDINAFLPDEIKDINKIRRDY
jgi:hypothetical protein